MSASIICDLGFGDSGKGSWTDYLARDRGADLVVRYNGGAQAAHSVVSPDGRAHIFSQFGSATLVGGVETLLSRYMLVNPLRLAHEAARLLRLGVSRPYECLYVDERALITTPYQMAANRIREYCRGANRHGSCGLGIGETMADSLDNPGLVLTAGDLTDARVLAAKLRWHREHKLEQLNEQLRQLDRPGLPEGVAWAVRALTNPNEYQELDAYYAEMAVSLRILTAGQAERKIRSSREIIFEGAQGVLLDEWRGFHPHTTWSTTTPANARALLQQAGYDGEVTVYGLCRAYATRHGVGPFPTEDVGLTAALNEPDNPTNDWQGPFRLGWLDLPLLRYALRVAAVDGLLVTALDRLPTRPQVAVAYRLGGQPYELALGEFQDLAHQTRLSDDLHRVVPVYEPAPSDPGQYAAHLAQLLDVPLLGVSYGKTSQEKHLIT